MFAVVQTSGKQYRVEPGATIVVDRMKVEEGATITLDQVLMVGGDSVRIGTPTVAGVTVTATVVSHDRGDKVITLKYRPKHRTRRRVGFRSSLTTLQIVSIDA